MSAELSDWLAELCAAGPGSPERLAATETGAAIAAVMSAADPEDLALVTDLAGGAATASGDDQLVELDYAYQQLLEGLQRLRRQVAEAASFRHTTRSRITPAGHFPLPFTADEIAAVLQVSPQSVHRDWSPAKSWLTNPAVASATAAAFGVLTPMPCIRDPGALGARSAHCVDCRDPYAG